MKALNFDYKVKSRNTYRSIAKQKYDEAVEKLNIAMAGAKYVSITTDMWPSNKQESYISITVHWLEDDLKMQHCILTTEEIPKMYSGVNICTHNISECLRAFGIEQAVVATLADNGSNVKKSLMTLGYPSSGCFAHSLQLGIKVGLKVLQVKSVRVSAKYLVTRFKQNK